MILCRNLNPNDTIGSIQEWFRKCPPEKGEDHWADERSAKELAKYWCKDPSSPPSGTQKLLESYTDLSGVNIEIASPEYETRFDTYGKGRQHDLLLLGKIPDGAVVIGIEAKVDERFGDYTTGDYYRKWLNEALKGKPTNIPARIEELLKAIFQPELRSKGHDTMYQLLHATAGTLAEARMQRAGKALLLIQTFLTERIDSVKHQANLDTLDFFVRCLSAGSYNLIKCGDVLGPLSVPGNQYIPSDVDLYIGCQDIAVAQTG